MLEIGKNNVYQTYANAEQKNEFKPYEMVVENIRELSKKHRYWKLHILNNLTNNTNTGELSIDALFVPLLKPELFTNPANQDKLVNNYHYGFSLRESRRLQLGIGQLPILIPGMIFKDGYPLIGGYPRYLKQTFKINPTEKNQKIISGNDTWGKFNGEDRAYIPNSQFQILQETASEQSGSNNAPVSYPAKFLLVDFQKDEKQRVSLDCYPLNHFRWFNERGIYVRPGERKKDEGNTDISGIIFPCTEMARFYMTFSSQSCQQLFSDGLAGYPNRMFKPEHTLLPDNADENGAFRLSKFMVDEDWKVLVRPAFDDYALSEFRRVYSSQLKNNVECGLFLPEARFPFHKIETDLTVQGTYIQSGNRVYFLVFRIVKCTAEQPYKGLVSYYRDNPGQKDAPETDLEIYQDSSFVDDKSKNTLGEEFDFTADENTHVIIRNPQGGKLQNNSSPTARRKKIKLLTMEDERFEHQKTNPGVEEKPKTGNVKTGSRKPVNPNFWGISESEEVISTAPVGGSSPVTPVCILPNTDITPHSSIFGNWKTCEISDAPPKESAENEKPEIICDEQDKSKKKDTSPGVTRANLPVDFSVFEDIVEQLQTQTQNITASIICIPPKGDYLPISIPSSFPSFYERTAVSGAIVSNSVEKSENKRDTSMPQEAFVAEIKSTNNNYAYLFDIEATFTKTGNIARSFKMFLCFEKMENKRLSAAELREMLEICEINKGKWVIVHPEKSNKIGFSFKHNMDLMEKYAARIILALNRSDWWIEKPVVEESVDSQISGQDSSPESSNSEDDSEEVEQFFDISDFDDENFLEVFEQQMKFADFKSETDIADSKPEMTDADAEQNVETDGDAEHKIKNVKPLHLPDIPESNNINLE